MAQLRFVLANYFPRDRRGLVIVVSYYFTQLIVDQIFCAVGMLLYKIRCKYFYIFTFQKISNCLQKKLCDVSDSEDENDEILVVKSSMKKHQLV